MSINFLTSFTSQAGAVPLLASFLTHIEDQKLQSEAANALANISAGSADNTRAVIDAGVVPIATLLLESPSIDLQDHVSSSVFIWTK